MNDGRLSDLERRNQMALKFTDWFLKNKKENGDEQTEEGTTDQEKQEDNVLV